MTVAELIEKLRAFPQDAIVLCNDGEYISGGLGPYDDFELKLETYVKYDHMNQEKLCIIGLLIQMILSLSLQVI
jgi:hypothetical protein